MSVGGDLVVGIHAFYCIELRYVDMIYIRDIIRSFGGSVVRGKSHGD